MAANFPNSPSTNDTFTENGLTFVWDGSAWKLNSSSGTKGEKGQKGEVGVTGDKGQKGEKGEIGDKGQKGEIGATGGTGGTGQKGQKGEVGATGAAGNDGSDGDKGQKGEVGVTGDKGQKGEVGATGSQTFIVTNNGSSNYIIDGQNNPTLTLVRGFTYTFNVNASGHPFYIKTSATTGTGNQYTTGVTNNGVQVGTLTFVVPSNAPATLYYICQYHGSMVGTINTVENGQKGEKGQKGDTGEKGEKGQKGEIGVGQKGEKGTKGDKGEVGATGSGGSAGDKGSTGDKGDKGAPSTVAGDKGQKGEIGATGSGGSTGSDGDKGQKGEEGPQGGGAPVGQIVAWSGSAGSLPSGYFLCDGSAISRSTYAALFAIVGTTHGSGNGSSTFNIPDLRDRFVLGASNSTGDTSYPGVSPGATGGSADATLVSHSHTINNHTHNVSGNTGNQSANHSHTFSGSGSSSHSHDFTGVGGDDHNDSQRRAVVMRNDTNIGYQIYTATNSTGVQSANVNISISGNTGNNSGNHSHTVSGTTGNPSDTGTNSQGSSATNANLSPYYALAYIIQYAQGGTTAKGQKGEVGATGSGGSTGDKGQKGEVGDKGAASSVQGPAGDKGQKGEVGATGSGGSTGSAGDKGQKGEVGSTGSGGSDGSDGSDGDKGQKGEEGTQGNAGATGPTLKPASAAGGGALLTTNTSYQNVVNVTITPTQSNSHMMILATGTVGGEEGNNQNNSGTGTAQITRDTTQLGDTITSSSGKRNTRFDQVLIDTNNHGGSAVTYRIRLSKGGGNQAHAYLGGDRSTNGSNSQGSARLLVLEILQ